MNRVDVIIVNYLAYDCLERCLEGLSLVEGPSLGQVVVVDNSPKPPPAALRERFSWVRWLVQDKNLGFARGVNAALDVVDARFVCLLNPDSRVDVPFLARAAEWMVVWATRCVSSVTSSKAVPRNTMPTAKAKTVIAR